MAGELGHGGGARMRRGSEDVAVELGHGGGARMWRGS